MGQVDTYKNPGTCTLRSALKYPVGRISQARNLESSENNLNLEPLPPKRRKTLPFARLLTNEESWQQLKDLKRSEKVKK